MDDDLRKRIDFALERDFAGDFLFSEEESREIIRLARQALSRRLNAHGSNLSLLEAELIFVSCVLLAQEWSYRKGGFFDFLERELAQSAAMAADDLGAGSSRFGESESELRRYYRPITEAVDIVHERKGVVLLDVVFQKYYYATIIGHAFAPLSSTESFFDLLWYAYTEELGCSFSESEDISLLRAIRKALAKRSSGAGADSEEAEITVKGNSYLLRAGMVGYLMKEPAISERLIARILNAFNEIYANRPVAKGYRVEALISDWWERKKEMLGLKGAASPVQRKERPVSIANISLSYRYGAEKRRLFLHVPPIQLEESPKESVVIVVDIAGKELKEALPVADDGLLAKTVRFDMDLSDYGIGFSDLESLEARIMLDGEIVFESSNGLKRDFLLFDMVRGREIEKGACLPGEYLLFCRNLSDLREYPESIWPIDGGGYGLAAKDGEWIGNDRHMICFQSQKSEIIPHISLKTLQNASYIESGIEYRIADGRSACVVSAGAISKGFGLRIDGRVLPLDSFDSDSDNGVTTLPPFPSGAVHSVSLFRYRDNRVLDEKTFMAFDDPRVSFDREVYFEEEQKGLVTFEAEGISLKASFSMADGCARLSSGRGVLRVLPPILRYKIDDGEWRSFPFKKPLWKGELTNSSRIYVDFPINNDSIGLILDTYSRNGQSLAGFRIPYAKEMGRGFLLGESVFSLNADEIQKAVLKIEVGNRLFPVGPICISECFVSGPFRIAASGDQIVFDPSSFIGRGDPSFMVRIRKHKREAFLFERQTSGEEVFDVSPGPYDVSATLLLKETGLFSNERHECEIWPPELLYDGDPEDLCMFGKAVRLVRAFDEKGRLYNLTRRYVLRGFTFVSPGKWQCNMRIDGTNTYDERKILGNMNPCLFVQGDGDPCRVYPKHDGRTGSHGRFHMRPNFDLTASGIENGLMDGLFDAFECEVINDV